jgi:dihydropteroate synthase
MADGGGAFIDELQSPRMRMQGKWKLRTRELALGRRTLIMGVLNVTPDSFSDGGLVKSADEAIERGIRLLALGADILDIGGESTRPGAKVAGELGLAGAVSAEEECGRILPVIEGVLREIPDAVISVDTYKAAVARKAVEAGAEIVNDVSGLRWDSAMAGTMAQLKCGVVIMHTRGVPSEWRELPPEPQIVELVKRELQERVDLARQAGVADECIVLDPGFGFGKNFAENLPLLSRFEEFAELGFPLLAGTSRKSFLGRVVASRLAEIAGEKVDDLAPSERLMGTIASTVIAAMKGAQIVRVHDVKAVVEAMAVVDAVRR